MEKKRVRVSGLSDIYIDEFKKVLEIATKIINQEII